MLDSQLHFLLLRCYNNTSRLVSQRTQKVGLLSGQPKILECLLDQDGRTPKELGLMCALDKSTITSLLAKMERQELVRRVTQDSDRRSVRIYLTDLGREKAYQVIEIFHDVDEMALQELSQEERGTLIQSLQSVLKSLEGITHV